MPNYSTETPPETIALVTAARIERGQANLIIELYDLARAHERGQQLPPSTPGMQMLLDYLKQRYQAETERAWKAQYASYPPDAPAALGDSPRIAILDWLLDKIDDDVPLSIDEQVDLLLSMPRSEVYPQPDLSFLHPPVAHGIAPLPPLGGLEAHK